MQPASPLSLKGSTVLVTGGTTGIGRAIAIALARDGARLFVFGRHQAELEDALKDIRKHDPEAQGVTADVAKAEDVEKVFAALDEAFGDLDILINNAALASDGLAETDDSDWRYVIETNVNGYYACAKAAADRMIKRKQGQIIMVGSISADTRGKSGSVYSASKAANQAFAESFAKEMAEHKIRVSLIEPGTIGTNLREGETPEQQRKEIKKETMLPAEDVADAVCFMLTRPLRVNLSAVTIIPRLQEF